MVRIRSKKNDPKDPTTTHGYGLDGTKLVCVSNGRWRKLEFEQGHEPETMEEALFSGIPISDVEDYIKKGYIPGSNIYGNAIRGSKTSPAYPYSHCHK